MADVFRAQCKLCGKEFQLRPDQIFAVLRGLGDLCGGLYA